MVFDELGYVGGERVGAGDDEEDVPFYVTRKEALGRELAWENDPSDYARDYERFEGAGFQGGEECGEGIRSRGVQGEKVEGAQWHCGKAADGWNS